MLGFPLYLLLHKDFSPLSTENGVPTHPGRAPTHIETSPRAPDIGTKGHGGRQATCGTAWSLPVLWTFLLGSRRTSGFASAGVTHSGDGSHQDHTSSVVRLPSETQLQGRGPGGQSMESAAKLEATAGWQQDWKSDGGHGHVCYHVI